MSVPMSNNMKCINQTVTIELALIVVVKVSNEFYQINKLFKCVKIILLVSIVITGTTKRSF